MERNANYALVGLSTILLFIGLAIFAIWLGRVYFGQQYDTYDVVFKGPVNGLSQGGEVHFNGIKVGDVRHIGLDATDPTNVVARVQVESTVPIRTDSYATLEPMGITGINFVQISAGSRTRPLLKDVRRNTPYPVIHSQNSALGDLLAQGGNIATRATQALDRVNRVLSDDNIRTLTATLSDIQAVTAELRARRAIIADAQHAVRSADHAIQTADAAAVQIRQLATTSNQLVSTDGRRMAERLVAASGDIQATAAEVRGMVQQLHGPTSDFATTGLPQLQAAIASLQQASDTLNSLATEVQQNPQGLISRAPAREVTVHP
jgi:phospholipid/cholesterol/gamma-HCH transport system substrate-binding protein